jgi:hypothetical protein
MTETMTKPSGTFPTSETSTPSFFPPNLPDPSGYKQNFDQLINRRGIKFMHYKSLPCPNIKLLDDNSHDPLCEQCDGSGIIYYEPKEIVGILTSNSVEKQFEYQGAWEIGSAVVTMPSEYADGEQADFTLYDKLEVLDYTVRLWELKEYEPRPGGIQQLRYPIEKVGYLITATDSKITEFKQDVDFTINNGLIVWIPGHEPSYDNINEMGQTYSVAYWAHPVYVVLQPMRELRVTQQMMPDGTKISVRLPQQLVIKRDFLVNKPEKIVAGIGS